MLGDALGDAPGDVVGQTRLQPRYQMPIEDSFWGRWHIMSAIHAVPDCLRMKPCAFVGNASEVEGGEAPGLDQRLRRAERAEEGFGRRVRKDGTIGQQAHDGRSRRDRV